MINFSKTYPCLLIVVEVFAKAALERLECRSEARRAISTSNLLQISEALLAHLYLSLAEIYCCIGCVSSDHACHL